MPVCYFRVLPIQTFYIPKLTLIPDAGLYTGETRALYFDNISWYNVDDGQTDGYQVVAP